MIIKFWDEKLIMYYQKRTLCNSQICIREHGLNLFEHQLVKCLFLDARREKCGYEWLNFNRTKNRTTDRTNRTKRLIFSRKGDIIELQNKWILWLIYQVFSRYGRLAQLVELPLDVRKVRDSSSLPSTI